MTDDDGDVLLRAVRALSSLEFGNTFVDITRSVVELLGCRVAILGRYVDVDGAPGLETLAFFANGRQLPNQAYALAGTPCETVRDNEFQYYPSGVGMRFPIVAEQDAQIDSYAAHPLVDSQQRALGLLTVMDSEPFADRARVETLLRIFAERAVSEMERATSAAALRASEEQYRAIFNASLDGLVLLRTDGIIVDVNVAIERMYGFRCDDLCGKPVLDALARGRREAGEEFLRDVLAQGYAETTDWAQRSDGSRFDIEARAVLMDYQGETHVLASVRDVSEDLKRDRALQNSESLLRATVESGLDCIIVMDEAGDVMEFNPAAERCFGFRRDEVIGRCLSDLIIPPRLRHQHDAGLEKYLETGYGPYLHRRIEVTAMRSDGAEFPVELTIGVARGHGRTLFIGYLRDITERHEAERQQRQLEGQLRQAQKMEALGHLTGGIAHDFNNILTSVLGYVEMAADLAGVREDEKLSRYLLRARLSGERARDLVQQMLTFSRGQQGERRALRPAAVVEEGMYLLESTMPATVSIVRHFDDDLPRVVVDPLHIEQVLVNLCLNARDAMDGSGSLAVSLGRTTLDGDVCSSCHQGASGEFLELSVRDSGPGLDAALRARIFEPFFSTKETGKGSGMGLATVHGIVHEYGGHIMLESEPGEGSDFRVFLPLAAAATDDERPEQLPAVDDSAGDLNGHVLVIDDNLVVAEFLDELLTSWGLRVSPFSNANAALRNFTAAPSDYDLVISDQTMPDITGLEVAREILAMRPGMPVILYTGFSETVSEPIALEAGVHALIYKPLDIPQLRALLNGILGADRDAQATTADQGC